MMCFGLKDRKRAPTNHCVIVLLDDTQLVHELHASSTGQDLLDVAIKHLNLLETAYFGLRYLKGPAGADQVWLEGDKGALRQLRHVQPMTVYFGIKFYAPDPCKLAEEITRYQFFLQCKQDILQGRLPVSFELAVELFALAIQSELGDYDPQRHLEGYASEFHFSPNQSQELERRAAQYHRNLVGQVPASAELSFLERVKWLDLYGCELHPIQYEDNGEEYALGLNPAGVLVLRNRQKVALNAWARIVKTKCQGRCFLMDVIESKGAGGEQARNRFGFRLIDKEASRRLARALDEHKHFHHLIRSSASLKQLAHQHQQHLKLSQRFRNSIRSAINIGPLASLQQQQQQLRSSMKSLANHQLMQQQQHFSSPSYEGRPQPTVVRMPSRRYGSRSQTPQYYGAGPGLYNAAAGNGNGLPAAHAMMGLPGQAQTMVDSQRQQALMLMSQLHHQHHQTMAPPSRSQTLRPVAHHNRHEAKEAKRNPYYQMMMMMASQQQQQQQQGRHPLQPAPMYKSSSVMNGLHQVPADSSKQHSAALMFYNGQPQWAPQRGGESPRSTKSALGTSSAMRQASRKLAKQQLFYDNHPTHRHQDVQPLLAYDSSGSQQRSTGSGGGGATAYYGVANAPYSASQSPRSVRSARLASRHKSRSTNENLNLMHVELGGAAVGQPPVKAPSKMLLATATQLNYLNSENELMGEPARRRVEGGASRLRKRTTFALDAAAVGHQQVAPAAARAGPKQRSDEDDDDYYCSRSDCSSEAAGGAATKATAPARKQVPISGGLVVNKQQQQEWSAIRKRQAEYLLGDQRQQPPSDKELAMECNSQLIKNIANKQATPILLSMNHEQVNANNKAIQLLNLQRQQLNSSSSVEPQAKSSSPVAPAGSGSSAGGSSVGSSPGSSPKGGASSGGHLLKGKSADSTTGSSSTTSGYYGGSNSIGSASLDGDRDRADRSTPSSTGGAAAAAAVDLKVAPGAGSRAKIALGSYGGARRNSAANHLYQHQPEPHLQPLAAHKQEQSAAGSPAHSDSSSSAAARLRAKQQQFYLGDNNNHLEASDLNLVSEQHSPATSVPQESAGLQVNPSGNARAQWSPLNQIQQAASLKYVSFDV